MKRILPIQILLICGLAVIAMVGNKAATVFSENAPIESRRTVIIDPGHGGVDGGATSCTGILESQINLDIALKLNDLMHLLGIKTTMLRTSDCSIYIHGDTIAAKKVSDLKERVRIVNDTPNALLVSIHQNYFTDSRYCGAQVFYSPTEGSKELATYLQTHLVKTLNPGSNRVCKEGKGIYLLDKIKCPGILVECGFLSNPVEESKLCDASYQRKLCCVIAGVIASYSTA